jgi:hypothetical protein
MLYAQTSRMINGPFTCVRAPKWNALCVRAYDIRYTRASDWTALRYIIVHPIYGMSFPVLDVMRLLAEPFLHIIRSILPSYCIYSS